MRWGMGIALQLAGFQQLPLAKTACRHAGIRIQTWWDTDTFQKTLSPPSTVGIPTRTSKVQLVLARQNLNDV
jgi:hypothetical protein